MENSKIDCKYLYSILFLSRLFSVFFLIGSIWNGTSTGDKIMSVITAFLLSLISAIPTVIYLKSGENKNITIRAEKISPVWSKCIAAVYIIFYLFICIITGIKFDLFATSIMSPYISQLFFLFIIILCAGYGAYLGLKTISRASAIITAFVGLSIVFMFFTLINKINFNNLTPAFSYGLAPAFNSGLYFMSATAEISSIVVIAGEIKGKIIKNLYLWLGIIFSCLFILVFLVVTVQGKFSDTRLFPIYSIIIQAGFGIFQRLDTIQTGIWTLCLLARLCFFIRLITDIAEQSFNIKKRQPLIIAIIAVITASVCLVSNNIFDLIRQVDISLLFIIFVITTVIIPLSVPVAEKIKNGKSTKAEPNSPADSEKVIT